MPFTCPRCSRTSNSPMDALEGYCGACHGFTGTGHQVQARDEAYARKVLQETFPPSPTLARIPVLVDPELPEREVRVVNGAGVVLVRITGA